MRSRFRTLSTIRPSTTAAIQPHRAESQLPKHLPWGVGRRLATCVGAIGISISAPCFGQSFLQQIQGLQGAASSVLPQLLGSQGGAGRMPQVAIPNALRAAAQSQVPNVAADPNAPSLWANKQAFLDSAAAGNLIDLGPYVKPEDQRQISQSVAHILYQDYGVPLITQDCGEFQLYVPQLMADITRAARATLGSQPPNFINVGAGRSEEATTEAEASRLEAGNSVCGPTILGQKHPHPYAHAVVSLMGEYATATKTYVDQERARRVVAYQTNAANQKAAEDQRVAAERASAQQKLDAEAARIRADEEKRAQQKANRIGG